MTGRAGMQTSVRGLLGIRGDGMFEFERQRQIMTPQPEYPIFTPVSSTIPESEFAPL